MGEIASLIEQNKPALIAAAWASWHARHGGKLGPGPAFSEAIDAVLSALLAASQARETDAAEHIPDAGTMIDVSGLVERCREIVEWRRTGILAQDGALKKHADAEFARFGDERVRQAESATLLEAASALSGQGWRPVSELPRAADSTYLVCVENVGGTGIGPGWVDKAWIDPEQGVWFDGAQNRLEVGPWKVTKFKPWPELPAPPGERS